MSKENFAQFMQHVQQNQSLQQKFAMALDKEAQLRLAIELGHELGCEFTRQDVVAVLESQKEEGEMEDYELEAVAGGRLKMSSHDPRGPKPDPGRVGDTRNFNKYEGGGMHS